MHKLKSRLNPTRILEEALKTMNSAETTRMKLKRDFLEEDNKWGIKRTSNHSSTFFTETDRE